MTKAIVYCFTIVFIALLAVIALAVDDIDARLSAALDAFGMFLWALGIVLIVAMVLFATVALYALWTKFTIRQRRPVDGAYPLQVYRLRRWRRDLPALLALLEWLRGERMIVNVNNMVSAAAVVGNNGYSEIEPAAGWAIQAQVRQAVERTNSIRAMFPGDDVRSDRYGSMSQMPRPQAGAWRVIDGKHEPPALPASIDGEATPLVRSVGLDDALRGNTATEFAVGQDVRTGEVVRWNLERHPHARFHGTTQGSGKTNLAKGLLLGLRAQGAHIVVLDRRAFKNFGELHGYAEFIPTNDPARFVTAMQRLCDIYQERDRLLGAQGAADITQLRQPPPRYGVLLCEFGSLCEVAQAEGLLGAVLQPLRLIMREAAATGVHLFFEDQTVERGVWPRSVQANASAVFTGYLPSSSGQAGGYYHAHKLGQYEFHYDGRILKGWNIQAEAPALLRSLPRRLRGDLLLSAGDRSAFGHPNTPPLQETERPNEHRTPNDSDDTTDLQRAVWAWRDAHPNGTQAELRKYFAGRGIEIARGYAHECWHKWPGAASTTHGEGPTPLDLLRQQYGNDIRLPSGERLGTDVTYGD